MRRLKMMGRTWFGSLTFVAAMAIGGGDLGAQERTQLVNTLPDGTQGNRQSREPSISADGRFVCFESRATNLVPDDTNGVWDVFVKDMKTGEIIRCSVNSDGEEANDFSTMAIISADGSIVAFMSAATNLVPNDTNNDWDYFVHDLRTRETTRVSTNSQGEQANGGADCDCRVYKFPGVSADGRYISFHSSASNLVPNDTNNAFDIFRKDRQTGEIIRISVSSDGEEANDHNWIRDMSLDGRYIVWHSSATNLVPNDTNGQRDIFIHDVETGTTERISVSSDGEQADDISDSPRVSLNGQYVAFASLASNLVDGDRNGEWDVFLRDRREQTTRRVSVTTDGTEGDIFSRHPSISANGRWITFHSVTTNLVPGDENDHRDIFLHDAWTEETVRISVPNDYGNTNERSFDAFISPRGQWIVYDSVASNLVENDTNDTRDIFRMRRFGRGRPLTLSDPVPGRAGEVNWWRVEGGLPGANARVEYSRSLGEAVFPGCPTESKDLRNGRFVGSDLVMEDGEARIGVFVPQKAAGRTLYFQAFERTNCTMSNVIEFTFPEN